MRRNHPLAASHSHLSVMTQTASTRANARRNSLCTDYIPRNRRRAITSHNPAHQRNYWDTVTESSFSMKRFKNLANKQKKLAKKTKGESIETARDAAGEEWVQAVAELHHSSNEFLKIDSDLPVAEKVKLANYQSAQQKFQIVRQEIEENQELLKTQLEILERREIPGYDEAAMKGKNKKSKDDLAVDRIIRPGPYTLMVQKKLAQRRLADENCHLIGGRSETKKFNLFDKSIVNHLIEKSAKNMALSEMLLYDVRYDNSWKPRYTKMFAEGRKEPANRAGWVLPLQKLCDQVGANSDFFTKNKKVNLAEARAFILYQRLTRAQEPSEWLKKDELNCRNHKLEAFFKKDWDGSEIRTRMQAYNRNVENDRDRVRLQDRYYNNIVMWRGLFGIRKQVFIRTMIGGMERRFEILDNQVNHIVFTHRVFDEHLDLCRNKRIKCRDSTRVILRYPSTATHDFIHANYIEGGPLFNKFIITQAPMENTIGDFWRMVWQEKSPYIFMLISRKDQTRCASYWPRKKDDQMSYYGLTIINYGMDEYRVPLFRITYLVVIGPGGEELHVEHWQGDMNNSDNVVLPLQLLRLARNCSYPTIVHCHLGISRSATVVAAEICITSLLKGPSYKHCVQKAVQFLRSKRPFCIETPMQYIFVHRIVQKFISDQQIRDPIGFHLDYKHWIDARATRPFIDDIDQSIPGYRLLSPRIDPDLIGLARHRERPDYRRQTHDCVGQMPIPLEDNPEKRFDEFQLTKRYPRGSRYD